MGETLESSDKKCDNKILVTVEFTVLKLLKKSKLKAEIVEGSFLDSNASSNLDAYTSNVCLFLKIILWQILSKLQS